MKKKLNAFLFLCFSSHATIIKIPPKKELKACLDTSDLYELVKTTGILDDAEKEMHYTWIELHVALRLAELEKYSKNPEKTKHAISKKKNLYICLLKNFPHVVRKFKKSFT